MSNTQSDNKQSAMAHESIPWKPHSEKPCLRSELMAYAVASCPRLDEYRWWELAGALASSMTTTTQLCAGMALSMTEIKALWLAHWTVLHCVQQRREEWHLEQEEAERRRLIDQERRASGIEATEAKSQSFVEREERYHRKELQTLLAAMQAFAKAFYGRADDSPQAKYAEARLAGRRALMKNHHPMLDGFPRLVEILRAVCSQEVDTYITKDVQLPNDKFLETITLLACDQANPADVANPPARIRTALARQQRRRQRLYRERWMSPSEEQSSGLEDPREVESSAIAKVDWERGNQDLELPEDQRRAIEARIEGWTLQGSDAREYLGWDAARLKAVRRSLEPDRPWGKRLRKRFSAYDPQRKSKGKR